MNIFQIYYTGAALFGLFGMPLLFNYIEDEGDPVWINAIVGFYLCLVWPATVLTWGLHYVTVRASLRLWSLRNKRTNKELK